jgi:hypothetical protein
MTIPCFYMESVGAELVACLEGCLEQNRTGRFQAVSSSCSPPFRSCMSSQPREIYYCILGMSTLFRVNGVLLVLPGCAFGWELQRMSTQHH